MSGFLAWLTGARAGDAGRAQLIAARDRLRQQIQILEAGPVNHRDRTPETARLAEDLRCALSEIEAEIAEADGRDHIET